MAANNSGDAPIPLEEGVKHEAEPEAKGKAPANSTSTMLHRSGSRPQLDLSGAAIHGALEDRNPTILLPNQSDDISHLALDIGGSLIKLVYFSRHADTEDKRKLSTKRRLEIFTGARRSYPVLGGRLHFVKFETGKLNECLDFISSKQLHRGGVDSPSWRSGVQPDNIVIKATGGGAYKYADLFKERLGVSLEKEDEMDCLVAGSNFLLKAIRHEAFTHMDGQKEYVQIDQNDMFPYLLVNVGSGVSIIKVDGHGKFQRVSGTNVGGGTYWGLGRLMTECKSFDELLELSQRGDNSTIDMLVGDIYGGLDYSKIGLSASTIASSFGKTISDNKELSEYRPEDISLSLLRMISYNIGQISYLNALRYGLKRILFGGFFIRGHAYTMDTISFAVNFWSKGEAKAMFLRHEGFLGALGAFMSYEKHGLDDLSAHHLVERFPMGAPYVGGKIHGPPLGDLNEKISWMEKFVQKGTQITAPVPMGAPATTGMGGFERPTSKGDILRSDASAALNVGVLHLVPSLDVFPLLEDPKTYEPNTIDLDQDEFKYWFTLLSDHLPDLMEKAVASEGGTDDAKRRGDAFAHAFSAHLARLMEEPAAYGKFGLANLLELREECLREFQFFDAYASIKQRENEASLAVLPDLLMELDSMDEEARLLALIEGVLAANIFDWGSKACVDLYHQGTIIEIYYMSRKKMQRPWRIDDFDIFKKRMLKKDKPYKRALISVDNSGADVVLGMLPLARELLRNGIEVVLVANSLPALNDVTANELPEIVAEAAKHCGILRKAAEAGGLIVDAMAGIQDDAKDEPASVPLMVVENGCGSPCIDFRQVSSELAAAAKDADLLILEGMGRWALLHFIMPTLFDSHEQFNEWFSKGIEGHAEHGGTLNEHQLSRLHAILKPFMLRRVKIDVIAEMTKKKEEIVHCRLSSRQQVFYQAIKNKISLNELLDGRRGNLNDKKLLSLMNIVMQLRKVCNHPELFERNEGSYYFNFAEIPNSLLPPPFGELQDIHYAGKRNPIMFEIPKLVYEGIICNREMPMHGCGFQSGYFNRLFNIFLPSNIHKSAFPESTSSDKPVLLSGAFGFTRLTNLSPVEASFLAMCSLFERLAFSATHCKRDVDEIVDLFLDSEGPDLQFSQNDATKVRAVTRLLLSPKRADSSLLRTKVEIGLSDNPCEALVLSHHDRLVSNIRLLRSTYGFIPPARAPPINVRCSDRNFAYKLTDEMHDPWIKKLFLGFARTSEFNGPREPNAPNPMIQEVCSVSPIPEPILQLPYRIFGSSPPMSNFDPAKMLTDSGKLHTLDKLLRQLRAENHRVLLFAQMTKMLDILEDYMNFRKFKYSRLDGSSAISDRRDMVRNFQNRNDIFVFLLSTRAGGLGINLTAADTVIFYEIDWNPTQDQQAMDRTHRLGQTKEVTVYRLICKDTIEEKILQRAKQKNAVQELVMKGKQVQDDHLMRQEDVVSLLLDDTQIAHKLKEISMQAKDRLKKRRAKAIKVDKEGDLMLEDLDDPTADSVEQDNTTSKKKKSSHKKPLKSQDNDSDVKALTENDIPESGPAEDEDIASQRPKRSKRLARSTGDDNEPVAASDVEKAVDAAETSMSHDYHDAEESQDQIHTA